MIDDIISYFKNELSSYNLIFKHIKTAWFLFWLSPVILGISFLVKNPKFSFVAIGIFIGLFSYLNSSAKKILKSKYELNISGYFWGGRSFYRLKTVMLFRYLKNEQLDNEDKLNRIAQHLYKEAENRKYKGFLLPGAFIVLFLPIWNQVVNWFFNQAQLDEEIVMTFWVFIIVVFCISAIAKMFNKTVEELLNDEYVKIKNLASRIEEISLFLCEYKKESS